MKKTTLVATAAAIAISLGACAANEADVPETNNNETVSTLTGTINAGGASSMTAAQEAWRAGFQNTNTQVTVNYDPTGSGTGRQNFADGGYAFAGTDAAFSVDEAAGTFAACAADSTLVQIPVYISPIAIGFTLEGITSLNLDAETIAKIFTGAITTWNDEAIVSQNPGAALPQVAITPVHRSDKSGTTENFTDYLNKAAPAVWTWAAEQTWPEGLHGEAAEKTQGVRETVAATQGAIGYLDASQASSLGTVAVKVGENYQAYSAAAAAAAVGKSPMEEGRADSDVVVALDRTLTDAGTYPVVLISYIAACGTYADAAQGELVKEFLTYVVSAEGQQAAADNAGSAPITGDATLAAKVDAAVSQIS
ncbi:MAG: phosphate ABC transporter substrate-binding protein PstS [Propionibacteriaceae bacterium]|nr:phosphate ABC transporter substrate-binding protein PstS [Propionibacteriaceae bacterium]